MYGKQKSQLMALALVALAMMAVTPVMGSVIYIDFGTVAGSASGPDGAVWNVFGSIPTGAINLVDIENQNSGITMELTAQEASWLTSTQTNIPTAGQLAGWSSPFDHSVAIHDYFFFQQVDNGNAHGLIVFDGLDDNLLYTVSVLSQRITGWNGNHQRTSDITLNGAFSDGGVSEEFNAFTQGFQQRVVLTWTDASPNDGILTLDFYPYLDWGGEGRSYAYINAITITAIPEPASLLLMASGLAGLYGMRRRRRA